MIRTVAMLLSALVIAYGGITLTRYADTDDSPGGMVIGWVIVMVAVALGVRAVLPRQPSHTSSGKPSRRG